MNKKFINLIIIIFTLISFNSLHSLENKILFKINDSLITTIDFENRKKYLLFVGDNKNLDEKDILEDLISTHIFYNYFKNSQNTFDVDDRVNKIYNDILKINKKNKDFNETLFKQSEIIYNLRLDLIRKLILEELLNLNKKQLFINEDDNNLVYKYSIKYLNIYLYDLQPYKEEIKTLNIKKIEDIESYLNKNNISFFKNEKEISNINNLNYKIKNKIKSKNNFFVIEKNGLASYINVKKSFETYEDLYATIYSFESSQKIKKKDLSCENLKKNNEQLNLIVKKYEFLKLNDKIKFNLIDLNDYIEFINNDSFTYVILCELNYNKELLNNINLNKAITSEVQKIEKKFIKKYSKVFNLKIINE